MRFTDLLIAAIVCIVWGLNAVAAKTGVTRDAAGQATGAQLIGRVPGGQFFKPLGGGWTKK